MLPKSRPQKTGQQILEILQGKGISIDQEKYPLFLVGIRGYFEDTMGVVDENDRGIYDDAIYVFTKGTATAFNGNTDPSRVRKGSGIGAAKGMACLNTGTWYAHCIGLHKGQYLALVQRMGVVTVTRDGVVSNYEDKGNFGINIHRGGINTTSSEGCQTVPPAQYQEFIEMITKKAVDYYGSRSNSTIIPYVLIEL